MSTITSADVTYEPRLATFDWEIGERELGHRPRRPAQHRLVLQRPHLRHGPGTRRH